MKFIVSLLFSIVLMSALSAYSARTTLPLDCGWKFSRGDFPHAGSPSFDDSRWQEVSVPHDWSIGGEFDINIDYQMMKVVQDGETELRLRTGRTGALPCFGIGWYRKSIEIPADKKGSAVFLEFDGAMSNAKVYLNGEYVGTWPYGYASFSLDATKFAKFGEKNTLAVRLDNKNRSSRWYSGAGLYRNARLVYKSPTHVAYNGTYITTPKVSRNAASVNIKTDVVNPDGAAKISHKIYAPDNSVAALAESENVVREISVDLSNPQLWDIETPNLYRVVTSLFDKNGVEIDRYETRFGIRTIEFSRGNGFILNGKKVKIQGVCMHHDLGPIGAAVNERALCRQLETLKEMGCNSVRTSHNPPSPELLNLCDELGLTVQNEAFDEWRHAKCDNGYHLLFSEWAEKDLTAFVRRDRNHPCVIMWSIGNEVSDQAFADGGATAKFLTSIVHREDPTRPVTAGIDNWRKAFSVSKIPHELDIVGINYRAGVYGYFAKNYPDMIFHGSETASTVSTRGTYHFPAKRNKNPFHEDYQVSAYDLETPPWGEIPDEEFAALDDNSSFFGEYVWTGYDYLGEPTPYNPGTPSKSSYFGIMDLAGFKKDRFYAYQARWNPKVKVLHVFPHWDWPDRVGQDVPVHCYTNYDKLELFVNGKSMGVKSKNSESKNPLERYRVVWENVKYEAGEIKVAAYGTDGKKMAEKVVRTSGTPHTLSLSTKRKNFSADKRDLIFVEIDVVDKAGNFCPRAGRFMFVKADGAAKLKALCNGDPTDLTRFSSNYMKSFNGKLLAVLEPTGECGEASILVYGMNLKPQTLTIRIR